MISIYKEDFPASQTNLIVFKICWIWKIFPFCSENARCLLIPYTFETLHVIIIFKFKLSVFSPWEVLKTKYSQCKKKFKLGLITCVL